MEKEDKIKALSEKIFNALIEGGDSTHDDLACAIAYLVGCVDILSHMRHKTPKGSFAKYVYNLIGEVYNLNNERLRIT